MSARRRGNRGLGFDRDVKAFAPLFRFFQCQGVFALRDMVDLLNRTEPMGPYGNGWNHAVVFRMVRRGAELGECQPTQSRAEAARNRSRAQQARNSVVDFPSARPFSS